MPRSSAVRVLALAALSLAFGCAQSSEEALRDVLSASPDSPQGWVELLEVARDELEDEEEEALATEIGFALRTARATVSGASPCTTQQAEQRIRRIVEDVLDARRHGESTILPVEPLVCQIDPPWLAPEADTVVWQEGQISGHDFDRTDLTGEQMQLYLFTSSSAGQDLRHVEWPPNAPAAFEATIDLWSVDQDFTDDSEYKHLELWWGGERLRTIYMAGPDEDGSVPIPSDARLFSFMPTEQSGDDRDFEGACRIEASAEVMIKPTDDTKLVLQLHMHAVEVGRGTTTVMGDSDLDDATLVVFEAPEGYRIEELLSENSTDCANYTDEDHDVDFPRDTSVCSQGLVKQWRFLGDTDGDEAGTRSRMSVTLEDLEVHLVGD